jgi:hypothetical protein
VPGYAGVKANERGDRLADLTFVQGGIVMNRTNILNVLMKNLRVSDATNYSESTTMNSLHKLHIKADSAKQ